MQKNEMILFMTKKMFTRCQNLTDTDSRWWHPKVSQKKHPENNNFKRKRIFKENTYCKNSTLDKLFRNYENYENKLSFSWEK